MRRALEKHSWRSREIEHLLENGNLEEVLAALPTLDNKQKISVADELKHRLTGLFEEPRDSRLAYTQTNGETRAIRLFRELQKEGFPFHYRDSGPVSSNNIFHPYVRLALRSQKELEREVGLMVSPDQELLRNENHRRARVFYLPTPKEVMKYIAVQDTSSLDGKFDYTDVVKVPEGGWKEVYAAGIRQALLGVRGSVVVHYHRDGSERKSMTAQFSYSSPLTEANVEFLAGLADRGREQGFMTEFEVTLHGRRQGVKAFVYASSQHPIVALSTARLYVESLNENMAEYHVEKSMQLVAQQKHSQILRLAGAGK